MGFSNVDLVYMYVCSMVAMVAVCAMREGPSWPCGCRIRFLTLVPPNLQIAKKNQARAAHVGMRAAGSSGRYRLPDSTAVRSI